MSPETPLLNPETPHPHIVRLSDLRCVYCGMHANEIERAIRPKKIPRKKIPRKRIPPK